MTIHARRLPRRNRRVERAPSAKRFLLRVCAKPESATGEMCIRKAHHKRTFISHSRLERILRDDANLATSSRLAALLSLRKNRSAVFGADNLYRPEVRAGELNHIAADAIVSVGYDPLSISRQAYISQQAHYNRPFVLSATARANIIGNSVLFFILTLLS